MATGERKRNFWGLFSGHSPGRSRPKRAGPALRRLGFEPCEDRRLLAVGVGFVAGTLKLTGTTGAEQVTVLGRKSYVDIYVDGHVQSRFLNANAAKVSTIDFDGRGGGDSLTVQGIAGTGAGPGYTIKLTGVDTLSVIKGTNVRVGSNVALNLDTTSLWGTLDFDQSINGPFALAQTGPVVVDGTTTFDVGAASDVTLSDPANDFSTVVVRSAGNVALQDASAILFGESTVSGSLAVEANLGPAIRLAISQSGKLTVGGHTTLTVGPASSILLNHQSGTPLNPDNALVGTVSVAEAANATISNSLATHLGTSHVTGNLSIRAADAIDQVGGGALVVEKLATIDAFTANASPPATTSYDVTLDNLGNRFGTLSVPHAGNLTIDYAHALNLGKCAVIAGGAGTGNLIVTTAGDITQSGALVVGGYARLDAGPASDITLANPGNNFSSGPSGDARFGVGIDSGRNVSLRDANAVTLRASTVSGAFAVTAGGAINQNGDLLVTAGATTLAAGGGSMTLDNPGNDFREVAVTSGNTVRLRDTGSLVLGNWRIAGDLTLTAGGSLSQSASSGVVVGRTATFAVGANDIELTSDANRFGKVSVGQGNNVSLRTLGPLVLVTLTVYGDLRVEAGGAITDTGQVTVLGNTTITTGDNITLDTTSSTYGSGIDKWLSLAGNDVYVKNGADTLLGECSATGDLTVVAAGALTNSPDSGATIYTLTVAGTATLYAGPNPLVLYTDGSTFGTLVTVGNPVEINPP